MARFTREISFAILILFLIPEYEATAPLFLQAITSALATIPFSGGPMTTSLVGAKLTVGTKLLYYLGFFGRRSKPKPKPISPVPAVTKQATGATGSFTGGLQPVPLPYFLSGAGRFPQMGNNFGAQANFHQQDPLGGIDPAQLFQALRAQGFDANTAMQMINNGGFETDSGGFANVPQGGGFANVPQDGNQGNSVEQTSDGSPDSEDIESFFTFLKDMDENTCISRLVCDIGDNPSFLGEFSENIHSIVRSLDVQSTSGAFPYIAIMEIGRKESGCSGRFPECSDTAYEIVKNVAPSVGVPNTS